MQIYPVPLRLRLPVIQVPLRQTDAPVPLDLQALILAGSAASEPVLASLGHLSGLEQVDVSAYLAEAGYDDEELARALAQPTARSHFGGSI